MYPLHSYQHKSDREGIVHLKGLNWISLLSKKFISSDLEDDFYLLNLMDNIKMSESDFPKIHAYLDEACETLQVENKPTLFLDTSASLNTLCLGEEKTMIVISSGLLELLDEDEMKAAIAHEVGHLAAGHAFFKLLAENFSGLTEICGAIPGLTALSLAARIPLYDWFRKADLTADRAALLVCKDSKVLITMLAKLAGGSSRVASNISLENIIAQAEEVNEITDDLKRGSLSKKASYWFSSAVMSGIMQEHPWPSVRVSEILEWEKSEEYKCLQAGKIPEDIKEEKPEPEPDTTFSKITHKVDGISQNLKFWK